MPRLFFIYIFADGKTQPNAMKKDCKNDNNVANTASENVTGHTVTAKFSIEVTGEDEPTIHDKRRARWAVVALFFFVALILSILFFSFVDMSGYAFWSIIINMLAFCVSIHKATNRSSKEPTGHVPWYYGAL